MDFGIPSSLSRTKTKITLIPCNQGKHLNIYFSVEFTTTSPSLGVTYRQPGMGWTVHCQNLRTGPTLC